MEEYDLNDYKKREDAFIRRVYERAIKESRQDFEEMHGILARLNAAAEKELRKPLNLPDLNRSN